MNRRRTILLIDDNPLDADLLRETIDLADADMRVEVIEDGCTALTQLRSSHEGGAALPGLILLDGNLPGRSGREVLADLKADELLKRIPVIIFSSSASPRELQAYYGSHANAYIRKPVGVREYSQVVRALSDFWFGVVEPPPGA